MRCQICSAYIAKSSAIVTLLLISQWHFPCFHVNIIETKWIESERESVWEREKADLWTVTLHHLAILVSALMLPTNWNIIGWLNKNGLIDTTAQLSHLMPYSIGKRIWFHQSFHSIYVMDLSTILFVVQQLYTNNWTDSQWY